MADTINKKDRILEVVAHTTEALRAAMKTIPDTGKYRRNVFIKNYNRRPQNKYKSAKGFAAILIIGAMGASKILQIISQPIPRAHGIADGGLAIVGECKEEIIVSPDGSIKNIGLSTILENHLKTLPPEKLKHFLIDPHGIKTPMPPPITPPFHSL